MKKYIFTIFLFIIALICINNVYALDGSYSSSNFQIAYYNSPSGGSRSTSGYSDGLNTSINLNYNYLDSLYIQVFGNNNIIYKAGNTYTFDFKVNFNPKYWNYLDNNFTTSHFYVYGNTSASQSGFSADYISSSSLTISNVSNDNYQMHYIYKIVPESDLKYLLFKSDYPYSLMGANLEYVYSLLTVRVVSLTVTYQQGIGSAIDEQTIVIQNGVNDVINNNNQNTQDIINNQQQNTQDIINNQNSNTQQQIESQKVCTNIDNNNVIEDGFFSNQYGNIYSSTAYGITDYITLNDNITIVQPFDYDNPSVYTCYYTNSKTRISCERLNNITSLTIPSNAYYMRSSINKSLNKPTYQICKNGNQALSDDINNVNDTLNDDTPPSADISSLGNVQGLLPPGPVDSLLNIPFMFLTVITNSLGGTCTALTGTFVFGSDISFPCFDEVFYSHVPNVLMNFLSLIPAGWILIKYFKHLYKKVDRAVSMSSSADDEWGVL